MGIALRPVRSDEYEAFVEAARHEYAADIAANSGRAPEEARAEAEGRHRGAAPKLSVFGGNARARALYASLGYTEIAVEMTKRL